MLCISYCIAVQLPRLAWHSFNFPSCSSSFINTSSSHFLVISYQFHIPQASLHSIFASSYPSVWPHLPLNTSTSRIVTADPSHLQSQPSAFHPGIDSAAHNWLSIACNSLSHIDFMVIMFHLLLVNLFSKFLDDHHRKPRWNCGNRIRDHFVLYHFTVNQTLIHFVIWASWVFSALACFKSIV